MNKFHSITNHRQHLIFCSGVFLALVTGGCATTPNNQSVPVADDNNPNRLMVVDCLLPARVQQLGQKLTYLAPRRPIKTTQSDCEIRGGEYTAFDRANYATALKIWLPRAKEGDADAQTYVGEIYEKGLGLQADYSLALLWYKKAADQGYSRAMINLGYLYESGLGVPIDIVAAMNWYRKASGLSAADLEYVSSIERARRKAATEETLQLRQDVSNLQAELDKARTELAQQQTTLATEQARANTLRKRLTAARAKARAPTIMAAPQVGAKTPPQTSGEIQALRAQLAARDQQIQATKAALEKSRNQLASITSKMNTSEGQTAAQMAQLAADKKQQAQQVKQLQQKLQQENGSYEQQLTALKQRLTTAEQRQQELTAALGQSRSEQERLQRQLTSSELENSKLASLQQKLDAAESEKQKLEQSLAASRERETTLQAGVTQQNDAATLAELEKTRASTRKLEEQLNYSQQEQSRLQLALMSAQQAESSKSSEVAELQKQLADSESRIAAREAAINKLQGKIAKGSGRKKQEVAAIRVVETIAQGPAIEIIDPPVSITRSVPTAFTPPNLPMVEVIGKVTSAEQLMTFKINGRKQPLSDDGLFQLEQQVNQSEVPMDLLAIDKKGRKTQLKFMLVPKGGDTATQAKRPAGKRNKLLPDGVDFGNYHALIIGNTKYENLSNLSTPANDARDVEKVLRTRYGYKTTLLLDANRYQILSAMNKLRESLTEKDNLLIYYAGHGELDSVNLRGFWLPIDAEPDNSANWISNVAITDMLNIMSAKHILVIADSCYSGSLTRAAIARMRSGMSEEKRKKWYKVMSAAKTRTVLTSGGVKPVLDSAGGDHSIFAQAFLDVLNGNQGILEGFDLYRKIQKRVKAETKRLNVDQNPQYAPLKFAGHEAGEYFFLPSGSASAGNKRVVKLAQR